MRQKNTITFLVVSVVQIHNSDLTAWTANNIQDSGTLLEGLSTADLGTLAWTTSLLGTHGTRPTWTPEQVGAPQDHYVCFRMEILV